MLPATESNTYSPPLVYAVILNYNGLDYNEKCIHSLLAQTYEYLKILFVDNGSTDGSFAAVKARFGDSIEYLQNGENLFFAAGNNRGIERALDQSADYVFVVNNDTEFAPECVQKLVDCMQTFSDAGACQPLLYKMREQDRPLEWNCPSREIASAGILISLSGRCWDETAVPAEQLSPSSINGVTGGAMLISAKILKNCGLFDEKFIMYFEDVDLSLRIIKSGFRCYLVPEAQGGHHVSASTLKSASLLRIQFCETNALRLIGLHFPRNLKWKAFWISSFFVAGACLKSLFTGQWRKAYVFLKGYVLGVGAFLGACRHQRGEPHDLSGLIEQKIWFPPA